MTPVPAEHDDPTATMNAAVPLDTDTDGDEQKPLDIVGAVADTKIWVVDPSSMAVVKRP